MMSSTGKRATTLKSACLYSGLAQATQQDPISQQWNSSYKGKSTIESGWTESKIAESQICLFEKGRDQVAQPELWVGRSFCGHVNKTTWPDQERQQTHWPNLQSWQPNVTFIKEKGMGCIQLLPRTDHKEIPPTVLSPPVNQGLG